LASSAVKRSSGRPETTTRGVQQTKSGELFQNVCVARVTMLRSRITMLRQRLRDGKRMQLQSYPLAYGQWGNTHVIDLE
jgi:hypothetical protein